MAIDPIPASETGPVSIIENEIPAYRAISSAAIFSLLFGIASIFCFTHLFFLVVAVLAILAGTAALRDIRRRSDVLTGASFARVGITLGLICGIAAVTTTLVQSMMLKREASQFAADFVEVIKNEPVAVTLWYQQPPSVRSTKKPDEVAEELKKASSSGGPAGDAYANQTNPVLKMKEILKNKGDVHFEKIESSAVSGLTSYANALVEIHDAAGTDTFALVRIRKDAMNDRGEWTVEELVYPYKLSSFVEKVQAPDDGHGHGSH